MSLEPIRFVGEQTILNFYEAFSKSDFDTMSRMMHPDCVLNFPGSSFSNHVAGREAIIGFFRGVQMAMGGTLRFHNKWAIAKGDMIAVNWFTTGRPVHGGKYLNRGVAWYRLEDGLIREFEDFLDTEVIASFWPNGEPCNDFRRSEELVNRLRTYAFKDAVVRFESL